MRWLYIADGSRQTCPVVPLALNEEWRISTAWWRRIKYLSNYKCHTKTESPLINGCTLVVLSKSVSNSDIRSRASLFICQVSLLTLSGGNSNITGFWVNGFPECNTGICIKIIHYLLFTAQFEVFYFTHPLTTSKWPEPLHLYVLLSTARRKAHCWLCDKSTRYPSAHLRLLKVPSHRPTGTPDESPPHSSSMLASYDLIQVLM